MPPSVTRQHHLAKRVSHLLQRRAGNSLLNILLPAMPLLPFFLLPSKR